MKCQSLFLGKFCLKNIANCHLLKFLPSRLNVKHPFCMTRPKQSIVSNKRPWLYLHMHVAFISTTDYIKSFLCPGI